MIAAGNKRTRVIAAALQLAEEFISGSATESEALSAIREAKRFLPTIQAKQPHRNSYRRRVKPDKKYKDWISSLPCSVPNCQTGEVVEVAHIGARGLSNRCPDKEAAPFCVSHHRDDAIGMHGRLGKHFWKHYGLDRHKLIEDLNRRYDELRK